MLTVFRFYGVRKEIRASGQKTESLSLFNVISRKCYEICQMYRYMPKGLKLLLILLYSEFMWHFLENFSRSIISGAIASSGL